MQCVNSFKIPGNQHHRGLVMGITYSISKFLSTFIEDLHGMCTAQGQKALQWLINIGQNITVTHLPNIGEMRNLSRAQSTSSIYCTTSVKFTLKYSVIFGLLMHIITLSHYPHYHYYLKSFCTIPCMLHLFYAHCKKLWVYTLYSLYVYNRYIPCIYNIAVLNSFIYFNCSVCFLHQLEGIFQLSLNVTIL